MSKYQGLFTFDAENHRYVPVEQADVFNTNMGYRPEPKEIPKDVKKIRKIIGQWAEVNGATELNYIADENSLQDIFRNTISFNRVLDLKDGEQYNIDELCG